jgi:predicted Zn finger-like uncharacterized protein
VYLTCPTCQTVYAVRAAMLRDGQGEVRCGACRSVFYALDCLSDELPRALEADGGASPAAPAPGPDRAPEAPALIPVVPVDGVPAALREDLERVDPPPSPALRNAGVWAATVLLLVLLGVQYLWFAPGDLAARFPMARTAVERFCVQAGCMQRAERAPERIRMISRDVRAHPRYEGALLVSATFTNAAPWPQPFPHLRFTLYDVSGATIAVRTFVPEDYLAGVLPADAPLPPGQPVQIGLEVLAPEQAAVSFEFEFL